MAVPTVSSWPRALRPSTCEASPPRPRRPERPRAASAGSCLLSMRITLQVLDGDLVVSHVAGPRIPLKHAGRERRRADRARRAVEHRAVAALAAPKLWRRTDALGTPSLRGADRRRPCRSPSEDVDEHPCLRGCKRGSRVDRELPAEAGSGDPGLLVVAARRLVRALRGARVDEAQLHGFSSRPSRPRGLCTTTQGRPSMIVTGATVPSSRKIWLIPTFRPIIASESSSPHCPGPNALISTSTPAGRSSFIRASTVSGVGSQDVRTDACACGSRTARATSCRRARERSTVQRFVTVGSGIGPATRAPVSAGRVHVSPSWTGPRGGDRTP